jgi:hypothetical protein
LIRANLFKVHHMDIGDYTTDTYPVSLILLLHSFILEPMNDLPKPLGKFIDLL